MDKKSERTLKMWGAEKILTDLVNVSKAGVLQGADQDRCAQFFDRYRTLRKGFDNPSTVFLTALIFQKVWDSSRDAEAVTSFVDSVFAPGVDGHAVVSAKSLSRRGKFTFAPRDLLDALGMELLRKRKMLHKCERCERRFIKTHSRDRYCSVVCSEEATRQRQAEWARQHRAEAK